MNCKIALCVFVDVSIAVWVIINNSLTEGSLLLCYDESELSCFLLHF